MAATAARQRAMGRNAVGAERLRDAAAARERAAAAATPAARPGARPGSSLLFQLAMATVITVALLALAVVFQRITIIDISMQAHEIRQQIEDETQMRENLEAQSALLAASPQLQEEAVNGLKMVPADNVRFVDPERSVPARKLAKDLKFFDRWATKKIRAYRANLLKAKEMTKEGQPPQQPGTAASAASSAPAKGGKPAAVFTSHSGRTGSGVRASSSGSARSAGAPRTGATD